MAPPDSEKKISDTYPTYGIFYLFRSIPPLGDRSGGVLRDGAPHPAAGNTAGAGGETAGEAGASDSILGPQPLAEDRVKMFLAATALPEFWDKQGRLLFLGPWCQRDDRRLNWEDLHTQTLPSPWDAPERFHAAVEYLNRRMEQILLPLADCLKRRLWSALRWTESAFPKIVPGHPETALVEMCCPPSLVWTLAWKNSFRAVFFAAGPTPLGSGGAAGDR